MGLKPLFKTLEKGVLSSVYPKILDEDKEYDPIEAISTLAQAIKVDAPSLLTNNLGLTTFAAYTLLEILHLSKMTEEVKALSSSPDLLTGAAFYCALGIMIGRKLPKEIEIKTTSE
jgi:hypothetical protein